MKRKNESIPWCFAIKIVEEERETGPWCSPDSFFLSFFPPTVTFPRCIVFCFLGASLLPR